VKIRYLKNYSLLPYTRNQFEKVPTLPRTSLSLQMAMAVFKVVAYDEDHSEKQRIMERVRTRSMKTSVSSGSAGDVQRKNMTWKATELKRLLKAADANK
jgi:hypothetical protein